MISSRCTLCWGVPKYRDASQNLEQQNIPMNYLLGKILDAIFRIRSGPCFDAHAQLNCFDFSISSKIHMFSTFSASNKHKYFAKFLISSNLEIKIEKRML